jgi:hypothetical protein
LSADDSTGSFEEVFSQLQITEHEQSAFTCVSQDTESTASTQSDDPAAIAQDPSRLLLNPFLLSCGVSSIAKPWHTWSDSSESTRQRYTKKSAEMVAAVLKTITPDKESACNLWKELITSSDMPQMLGMQTLSFSEQKYLEALAEAYKSASTWETRRQVLSIMSGVARYNTLGDYVPGLTRYRYSMANLHRLQFGSGPVVASQATHSRIRIDVKQLDHFLDFITSPHLVQDLPFGTKQLKLSTGEVIEVPNVIRTMIPQRIVKQYQQYCKEINFEPFSERTMLRVLSECSASVRKSLQGLDYFAAEGAQAFDNLMAVVRQISELGADKTWETLTTESLKAAKMYLKGDYKVKTCVLRLSLITETKGNNVFCGPETAVVARG